MSSSGAGGGEGGEALPAIGLALAADVQRDLREVREMLDDNVRYLRNCAEQTLKHYKKSCQVSSSSLISLHTLQP